MKLTKQRLKEIIKEEIQNLREARYQEIIISLKETAKVKELERINVDTMEADNIN